MLLSRSISSLHTNSRREDHTPPTVADETAEPFSEACGHNAEVASLTSLDRPPSEKEVSTAKVYKPVSFPVLALLAPASIFGLLARLGLNALATYAEQSVFSLAYVQLIGCFFMGIFIELKEPIGQFYGPLYTALTTGFCGSLTTFSGWQYDVFTSWINANDANRGGLRDAIDGITKIVITLSLSVGALLFGAHIGANLRKSSSHLLPSTLPQRWFRYTLSAASICAYAATIPAYYRLPVAYRSQATAALLFSYSGTLTRYLLSIYLNPRSQFMPLGTFIANAFGTALLGAFHILQNRPTPITPSACYLTQGLIDGYCGCLTTVSTFAAEIVALAERKRWRYVIISFAACQLILLVILEPSFQAGGVKATRTCTFT